jgi:imidazolonepropionase-like amidohydrolase
VGSPLASETVGALRPEDGREHFERLAYDQQYRDRTLAAIPDSAARSYFQRLAGDADLQAQVQQFQEETLVPAEIDHWSAFRRAFAGTLTLVQLDVPAVSGYEYNAAPELIAPHIRRFLDDIQPPVGADTVHVLPPTGQRETDRASILAALERVRPGGTVRFASGTYVIGEMIRVTVPRVTLLGHEVGTTLRGCDPEGTVAPQLSSESCNGLELAGARQTVRGLTFEYAFWALHLGCCYDERVLYTLPDGTSQELPANHRTAGGHLIEGNTFRTSASGLRVNGDWTEPAVVRNNQFIDNWHAVSINGNTVHLLDNEISVSDPARVPFWGFPWDGVKLSPPLPFQGSADVPTCTGNVIAGNRIQGYLDGIRIELNFPGTNCRGNVVRANTIVVARHSAKPPEWFARTDASDSTFVGVPISLLNYPVRLGRSGSGPEAVIEENLIEGNRIMGAEGIGIELLHASRNRIVGNSIVGIGGRTPFPGNSMDMRSEHGVPLDWSEANGSGIHVSAGSDQNEIADNTFEDVAAWAIVLEGDRNRVETGGANHAVRDLGRANRVTVVLAPKVPAARSSALEGGAKPDTLETERLVFHQLLHPAGEESYTLTSEGDGYLLHADFSHNDRGQTTERSVTLRFGLDLSPRTFQLRETAGGESRETTIEVDGRSATVTDASGSRRVPVPDPFFTTSAFAPDAVQALLVRYWLRHGQPDSIALLPEGHAIVRHAGRDTVDIAGEASALDRYHVTGVRWGGQTLWLDNEERLVAALSFDFGYQAVREGYQHEIAFFSELARRDLLARAEEAGALVPPLHTGTFALVGGTLIDGTGAPPLPDATVVVRDGRIVTVAPRTSVEIPREAAVVDVSGRTILPGLWDMHAHLAGITDFGPIYLAAGVTTVRDAGNETGWGLALREAFATGRISGPRVILAAEIDGRVPEAVGAIQADTPEEARALVRHFHELGYEQVKLYNHVRPELVPVLTEEAHRLGMTVTGHVPRGMNAVEAVQAGMDQINHLTSVADILMMIPATIRDARDIAGAVTWLADLDLGRETRSLVETLVRHGTVVDPTLAMFELDSRPASLALREIEPGAARMPPLVAATVARWPGSPADVAELMDGLHRKDVELVGILHRAGVPIVAGTDVAVPGHSLHRELELYVEAGMTPMEAIQAATSVPARAMGLDHDIGTVEVSRRADLIVIDGDPLRSIREIRNVCAVIANGRMFDTAELWRSVGFSGTSR